MSIARWTIAAAACSALLLAGCVNLHVHFPEAAPDKAASAAPAPDGAAK